MSTTSSEDEGAFEMATNPTPRQPTNLEENFEPAPGLTTPHEERLERENTRRTIAVCMMLALVGLMSVGAWGWITFGNDTERMQNFAIVFSPITAIFATIIGFYFSSSSRD